MWFMNKIVNPLMRLILRSPLHRLMSTSVLLITYHGRKSNKAYTLPVQYVQDGGVIYIIPGMTEKKTWWRSLRAEQPVQVTLAGKLFTGKGRLLDPAIDIEAIIAGLRLYLQQFPSFSGARAVRIEPDGTFNPSDLRQTAASILMVRVDLDN